MAINGWEHYDLEKEMSRSNMAGLLELFKRENERLSQESVGYLHSVGKLTEEGRKELEEKLHLIDEGRMKIALSIAEILTDTKRYQREISPKK